jgi:glucosamine-6-phosphate deaminase
MNIQITEDAKALGKKAGADAAQAIREALASTGKANIILATGTSQFETLKQLISEDIDWSKVVMFHLDEYIDLPVTHPASFRKYLQEKFIANVSPLKAANLVNGEADPEEECSRLGKLISAHPIDVALVGIGENGHLAFNDPPADFTTERPYIIVNLDEPCRRQQLGEGWFKSLDEVPPRAISMSVKQIMKSKIIICSVPDSRKALAVKNSVEQKISNLYPASILQSHTDCRLYLDKNSAAQLSKSSSYIS